MVGKTFFGTWRDAGTHLNPNYIVMFNDMHSTSSYSDDLAKQLWLASHDGHDQKVLELLQRGVPPNSGYYTTKHGGVTPLHTACSDNHLGSAELIIKFGAIVAATDMDGWTPLHYTCLNNSETTAKLLLEHRCPTREPGLIYLVDCLSN